MVAAVLGDLAVLRANGFAQVRDVDDRAHLASATRSNLEVARPLLRRLIAASLHGCAPRPGAVCSGHDPCVVGDRLLGPSGGGASPNGRRPADYRRAGTMNHENTRLYETSLKLVGHCTQMAKHFPPGLGYLADQLRRASTSGRTQDDTSALRETLRRGRRAHASFEHCALTGCDHNDGCVLRHDRADMIRPIEKRKRLQPQPGCTSA